MLGSGWRDVAEMTSAVLMQGHSRRRDKVIECSWLSPVNSEDSGLLTHRLASFFQVTKAKLWHAIEKLSGETPEERFWWRFTASPHKAFDQIVLPCKTFSTCLLWFWNPSADRWTYMWLWNENHTGWCRDCLLGGFTVLLVSSPGQTWRRDMGWKRK